MKKTLYSNTVKIVLSATISIIIATRLLQELYQY